MPGDAEPPKYVYSSRHIQRGVYRTRAVHAAVGFVLQISLVALALALPRDITYHDHNFCLLKLSFAYITTFDVNMHSHSCLDVIEFFFCMLIYHASAAKFT